MPTSVSLCSCKPIHLPCFISVPVTLRLLTRRSDTELPMLTGWGSHCEDHYHNHHSHQVFTLSVLSFNAMPVAYASVLYFFFVLFCFTLIDNLFVVSVFL